MIARICKTREIKQRKKRAVAPPRLFSGTLHFVSLNFPNGLSVPEADLQIAIQYLTKAAPEISRYCSAYGANTLVISGTVVQFPVTTTSYNDAVLEKWADSIAEANSIPISDCLIFLNPQGAINSDAHASKGVLGYHNATSNGLPYCFVNVLGSGFTIDDRADIYAVALSHEVAEMTVDTSANLTEPEVCDPCIPAGEVILGDNLPIEAYEIGAHILGRSGLQEVTETFARPYVGKIVEIKASGMLPLRATPNHKILCARGQNSENPLLNTEYLEPQWKELCNIEVKIRNKSGDYLLMPKLKGTIADTTIPLAKYVEQHRAELRQSWQGAQPNRYPHAPLFPLNFDTAWMLGVYVAEGYANHAHRSLVFSLHSKETIIAQRLSEIFSGFGFSTWIDPMPGESGIKLHVASVIFCHFFPFVCGSHAFRKRIPDFILYHQDERLLRSFLEGYLVGEGNHRLTRKGYEVSRFSTTSKILALQLQLAFGRLGIFVSLSNDRHTAEGITLGRRVQMNETYVGTWCSDQNATRHERLHGDFFYLPVKSVNSMNYCGTVHNFETEDHTYLVSNAITHNCAGNCSVDFRNFFDSNSNWIPQSQSSQFPPSFSYSFFVEGIVIPSSAKSCPAPSQSCQYSPP
jgi:hypothetical protein